MPRIEVYVDVDAPFEIIDVCKDCDERNIEYEGATIYLQERKSVYTIGSIGVDHPSYAFQDIVCEFCGCQLFSKDD